MFLGQLCAGTMGIFGWSTNHEKPAEECIWLVVWNMCFCPFHIWDVILPIDELHHISRWVIGPPTRYFFAEHRSLAMNSHPRCLDRRRSADLFWGLVHQTGMGQIFGSENVVAKNLSHARWFHTKISREWHGFVPLKHFGEFGGFQFGLYARLVSPKLSVRS